MGKARKGNTVTIQVPAELVERIAQLNEVDLKYIDRTIARILRDEIAVEEKLSRLQGEEASTRSNSGNDA